MAKHKLVLDAIFEEASYTLIAIHCTIEDYRLVYLLNKQLKISLQRKNQDLDYKYTSAWYAIYEWKNKEHESIWNLVSNICKKEEDSISSSGNLFNNQNKIIRHHNLVPEYKTANYFLKIDNENYQINEKTLVDSIQNIPQIVTAYSIDAKQLKSKDNLIFS